MLCVIHVDDDLLDESMARFPDSDAMLKKNVIVLVIRILCYIMNRYVFKSSSIFC